MNNETRVTKPAHRVPVQWQLMFVEVAAVALLTIGSMGILWSHWEKTYPNAAHPYMVRGMFAVFEFIIMAYTIWSLTWHGWWAKIVTTGCKILMTAVMLVHAAAVFQLDVSLEQQSQNVSKAAELQSKLLDQQNDSQSKREDKLLEQKAQAEKRGKWNLAATIQGQLNNLSKEISRSPALENPVVNAALQQKGQTFFSQNYLDNWFFVTPLLINLILMMIGLTVMNHTKHEEPGSLVYTQVEQQTAHVRQNNPLAEWWRGKRSKQPIQQQPAVAQTPPQIGFAPGQVKAESQSYDDPKVPRR